MPEWFCGFPKDPQAFRLPAMPVNPTSHRTAIGQMNCHSRLRKHDRPLNAEGFAKALYCPVRPKPRSQGRAGLKAIALVVEAPRATARVNVRLQHGDIQPSLRQQRPGRQPTNARAYDHNPLFGH
jgi:hypothetical protein